MRRLILRGDVFEPVTSAIPTFEMGGCSASENFPSARIVGPKMFAPSHSWPWMVRLEMHVKPTDHRAVCGATIVHNNFLLTAAHCCRRVLCLPLRGPCKTVLKKGTSIAMTAFFSDVQRNGHSRTSFSMDITAGDIIIHEKYADSFDGSLANHDICLIQLKKDIIATGNEDPECRKRNCVQIACLPKQNYIGTTRGGDACWVAGWGNTVSRGEKLTTQLLQGGVNVLSRRYCKSHVTRGIESYENLQPDEICAGNPDNNGDDLTDAGTDTCQGDSGGGLICNIDNRPILVGIVSWGLLCGREGKPGVYVNVNKFYDWIYDNVQRRVRLIQSPVTELNSPIVRRPSKVFWTRWSTHECSASCGVGYRKRIRNCRNGTSAGFGCPGPFLQYESCNTNKCPPNGECCRKIISTNPWDDGVVYTLSDDTRYEKPIYLNSESNRAYWAYWAYTWTYGPMEAFDSFEPGLMVSGNDPPCPTEVVIWTRLEDEKTVNTSLSCFYD